jgi:hypothetical protein
MGIVNADKAGFGPFGADRGFAPQPCGIVANRPFSGWNPVLGEAGTDPMENRKP